MEGAVIYCLLLEKSKTVLQMDISLCISLLFTFFWEYMFHMIVCKPVALFITGNPDNTMTLRL
ncbi:MAG TPA: hypothetical protein DCE42_30455 [Myxococcales bacterium]|nr:hypothetical protein [Deltaproteobacteria bacterium]MBU50073.1 hypothetical protein [Deltaproteobacteria bacterium]HAA59116.1 hypothetical protein [Myxococcales bacterium]